MKGIVTISMMLLFAMAGCGEGNKQLIDDFITVDVTASYPKKELILQDFLDVEYIPLETSDDFLTSASIQGISDENIILKNYGRDGDIFVFNQNGKALRKINRSGQGGEEYTNILGITLDTDMGEMFINNHYSAKILVYDLFGKFKRGFKQREFFFYNQVGDFNQDYLICHDGYVDINNPNLKRNYFLLVSKQDGSVKEIEIPYKEKKSTMLLLRDVNGLVINDRTIFHRQLIPYQDNWLLTEPSSDTIYHYSIDYKMKPFIVRTPSVQSMDPEIFLFPGVITDRYCFMQTVRKTYDFVTDQGFKKTDLMFDRQKNSIFECVVYNDDFIDKKPLSLVYEIPMFTVVNKVVAFAKKIEAHELVEAYQKGKLKGKLKEIAANLDEESNPVIMLAKYKK